MNSQPHLGPDHDVGQLDEHVERVGHPAVGRVFQRHQAELDVTAIDVFKDGRDRADRDVDHGLTKLGHRSQMAVAVFGAQVSHVDGALQRARAAHQLAENDSQRLRRAAGPWLAAKALRDDLVLARRRPDLDTLIVLDLADQRRDLGAAIEQADQVLIELVDLPPQSTQRGSALRVR